ncbi:LAMI_0H01200g1_1 [Lachancea mirantina]|uniref:LAMI_0H01200g1_1 n=1 Tax=Lachancea mirantina TaxID=1230905 RepID=A0A1G4KDU3_9SACH|nr:LAMI_0H01200g1_1 [Lachancea mirantina]
MKRLRFTKVAALWILLVTSCGVLTVLHLFNMSCQTGTGTKFCIPQYSLRFKEIDSKEEIGILQVIKDLMRLLSYVAIDFNFEKTTGTGKEYEDINLANTFHDRNTFELNYFGFCKSQTMVTKLPKYCVTNRNGFNPITTLAMDLGIQFGFLSSRNPVLMGKSFVLAYKSAIESLEASFHNKTAATDSLLDGFIDTLGDKGGTALQSKTIQSTVSWLSLSGKYCHVLNTFITLELIVSSAVIVFAPMHLTKFHNSETQPAFSSGGIITRVSLVFLPILLLTFGIITVVLSLIWFFILNRLSDCFTSNGQIYSVRPECGFYLAFLRLTIETIIVWNISSLGKYGSKDSEKHKSDEVNDENTIKLEIPTYDTV